MSFFDATLINIILVVFPFLLYFIYLVYNYEFNKKANELILDLSIITSYYFVLKYQNNINPEYPFFLLSVPLFISYSKIHGTGLGVPLMYEIIEAHDWNLNYESSLNEGTTVKIFMKKSKII